jgi:hypothetical protein
MAEQKRNLKIPTGAILSKYLRCLALEIETVDEQGDPVTKAQALAMLVWKHALGFKDRDDKGKESFHKPETWAIELLYNRIEGRIPIAVVEESGRSLTEKVSDLGKARINSLSKAAVDPDDAPAEEDDE